MKSRWISDEEGDFINLDFIDIIYVTENVNLEPGDEISSPMVVFASKPDGTGYVLFRGTKQECHDWFMGLKRDIHAS